MWLLIQKDWDTNHNNGHKNKVQKFTNWRDICFCYDGGLFNKRILSHIVKWNVT